MTTSPVQSLSAPQLGAKWLLLKTGSLRRAVDFSCLLKIVEKAEIFPVPLCGEEFLGVIYYEDKAVPVVNLSALFQLENQGDKFLILENHGDLIAIQAEEIEGILESEPKERADELWLVLKEGLLGLDSAQLFRKLREAQTL